MNGREKKEDGRKRAGKIVGICLTALMWAVLICSAMILILSAAARARGGGKSTTFLFGLGFYEIVSGSMEPEIHVGDVLVGKRADGDSVRVGDVILFSYGDKIIAHRLIAINGDGTVTAHGIANPDGANETFPAENIIARKVARLPGLGYVVNFVRSPYGFLLLIVLPIGGFIIAETVSLTRRLKAFRAEKSSEIPALKSEIEALRSRLNGETDEEQNSRKSRRIAETDEKKISPKTDLVAGTDEETPGERETDFSRPDAQSGNADAPRFSPSARSDDGGQTETDILPGEELSGWIRPPEGVKSGERDES